MATCPDVMISVQLHDWEAMSLQVTALRERLALAEGLIATWVTGHSHHDCDACQRASQVLRDMPALAGSPGKERGE